MVIPKMVFASIDAQTFSNFFRGYLMLRENLGGNLGGGTLFSCFIAFLSSKFLKPFEGVHEVRCGYTYQRSLHH
jgi:hypothetical protein